MLESSAAGLDLILAVLSNITTVSHNQNFMICIDSKREKILSINVMKNDML